jgi:hypothetical protein
MSIEFVRVNKAAYYTVKLFEIGDIRNHTFRLTGKKNLNYLDDWHEFIYRLHTDMEDEIQQTLLTNNKTGIIHLIELLDGWMNDFRIKTVNMDEIERVAEKYNSNEYEEYVEKIRIKVEEFMNTEKYQTLKHLEEYDLIFHGSIYGIRGDKIKYVCGKEIYKKFYCILEESEQIDLYALQQEYKNYITPIVNNFRMIAEKYVRRYNEGNIDLPSYSIHPPQLQPQSPKFIENKKKSEIKKLKTTLSVDQLAYLFKLLKDEDVFGQVSNVELAEFISIHFETPNTVDKDISIPKLKTSLSTVEPKTAKELLAIVRKMWDAAAGK